jgi:hypothetical protein
MSDFLDGLLLRSLQRPPEGSVQPRPRARFETPDGAAGLAPVAQSESPTAPDTAALTTATPTLAPDTVPAPTPGAQPPAGRVVGTIYQRETRGSPESLRAPADREEASLLPAPPVRSSSGERSGEAESGASDSAWPAVAIEPLRPRAQESAEPPSLVASPLPPAPWAEREAPVLPPRAEAPPQPQAGPLIQLTIGRIELIGPDPAPAPPRPAAPHHTSRPAQPVRSLDDYLRQRNERRK